MWGLSISYFLSFVCWDEKGEVSLVQALHDFRHNCTPTWLFIASGMIDYWWCHHWQWLMCNSKVSDPVLPLGQLLDLVGSNPSTVPRSKASNRKLQNCRGSNISVCIPSTDTLSNMGNDWAHPSGIIIHQRHEKDAKEDGDDPWKTLMQFYQMILWQEQWWQPFTAQTLFCWEKWLSGWAASKNWGIKVKDTDSRFLDQEVAVLGGLTVRENCRLATLVPGSVVHFRAKLLVTQIWLQAGMNISTRRRSALDRF